MFCPQCATSQTANAKFCRACGIPLDTVALALRGNVSAVRETLPNGSLQHWLKRESRAVSGIIRGGILFAVPALIAVPMAVFIPSKVPWMLAWTVFFGWMAVWGGIEMAYGLSRVVEAKARMRMLRNEETDSAYRGEVAGRPLPSLSAFGSDPDPAPASVTEGTTRHLDDSRGR